mmetsp:Transcript_22983/g.60104  ORF Transcript_22983/g.60104 Transcript_22983/m.60104 type:complete len:103 (+) Transcript_22983:313-621(+)
MRLPFVTFIIRVPVGRSAVDEVASKAIMSLLIGAIVLLDLCAYNGFNDTLCPHASESFECSQRHFCRSPRRFKRFQRSQRKATLPIYHPTTALHGCAQIDGV